MSSSRAVAERLPCLASRTKNISSEAVSVFMVYSLSVNNNFPCSEWKVGAVSLTLGPCACPPLGQAGRYTGDFLENRRDPRTDQADQFPHPQCIHRFQQDDAEPGRGDHGRDPRWQ